MSNDCACKKVRFALLFVYKVVVLFGVCSIYERGEDMSEDTRLILTKLDGIDGRLERLEEDVAELKEDVAVLKEDVAELKEDVAVLKEDVAELKEDVTNLQLVVENEIRPHIQILAEGHVMLAEKIDNILDFEKEKDEMKTRVEALETGFQSMQDKTNKTA